MAEVEITVAPNLGMTDESLKKSTSSTGGYWDMKENLKGTLSSVSLTGLAKAFGRGKGDDDSSVSSKGSHKSGASGANYWEWTENVKTTLSKVKNIGKKKDPDVGGDAPDSASGKNYWFWRNSFKSKSDLQAEAAEETAAVEGEAPVETPTKGGGYWFWRNPSLKSLSTADLDKLSKDQSSQLDDSSSGAPKRSGPISALDHKLRQSWRNSFKQLSSNSLTKLDESNDEKDTGSKSWKRSFKSFQSSFSNLRKQDDSKSAIDESTSVPTGIDVVIERSQFDESLENDESGGITF